MFGTELERGDEYPLLRPAISVLFLGYRELTGARVHSIFRLLEVHDHERFCEEIELHVIELAKLERATGEERRDEKSLLAWARFLAAQTDEEQKEAAMSDVGVEKAHKVLRQVSADPEARRLAEQRAFAVATLTRDIEAARKEGEAVGRAGEARQAILDLCEVLGIEVTDAQRASLEAMAFDVLDALRQRVKRERRWAD
jgi:predicted transposase/invertase (TIGR01784 family)